MTFQAVLGALLHDIGKFAQRSGKRPGEEQLSFAPKCCPPSQDGFSHHHVLHGARFVQDKLGAAYQEAADAVLFHHRPESAGRPHNALIVAVADRLSNGAINFSNDPEVLPEADSARLCSIFTRLPVGNQTCLPHFFPVKSLTENIRNHIPEKEQKTERGQYTKLWSQFVSESERLDVADENRLLRQLLSLLEKYTLFMPSRPARADNDVTLFHHLKITAAIASCLVHLDLDEAALTNILAALGQGDSNDLLSKEAFYLVGSDLSGIQSFIYSVASKGALKGLRGRSVYLSALVEIVAESLLHELDLNPSNMIYCGGGHAYFLAPKNDSAISILRTKQHAVNQILNDAHKGKLALAVAWQPMRLVDFIASAYVDVWEKLARKLAREKRRKACQFFTDEISTKNILGPFNAQGDEKACTVCGDSASGTSREEGDKDFRCSLCQSFERLSKDVARAQYLAIELTKSSHQKQGFQDCAAILEAVGGSYEFQTETTPSGTAFIINRTDFLQKEDRYLGFRFMGKHTPLRASNQLEDLESLADKAQELNKWGVLRADVDDLGKIMRVGVGGENNTIVKLSLLSHLIGLFFSAQPQLHAHKDPYREGISLVYAGGDDLFVIGAWSLLPGLAEAIQKDFSDFTNGAMDLSAGIFLSPSKGYPVYQAAALAGKAESFAKDEGKKTSVPIR
jgi:CRISPR-associated protein Csm1